MKKNGRDYLIGFQYNREALTRAKYTTTYLSKIIQKKIAAQNANTQ